VPDLSETVTVVDAVRVEVRTGGGAAVAVGIDELMMSRGPDSSPRDGTNLRVVTELAVMKEEADDTTCQCLLLFMDATNQNRFPQRPVTTGLIPVSTTRANLSRLYYIRVSTHWTWKPL
jgi:hypothetical protein